MATNDIATSCGFAEEKTAFGEHHVNLGRLKSAAYAAAVKLARVYREDHSDIYQGTSVGGIVDSSLALLGSCGLPNAGAPLRRALAAGK